jgi:DASH complex subunit DAD2
MSFPTRTLPHIRQGSVAGASLNASSAGQSAALQARVNVKKAELEHLRQLRDLSAAMATQMEALQQKLSTLTDGTEGTGTNWCNCSTSAFPAQHLLADIGICSCRDSLRQLA